ncbi:Peptidoglycan/LPS O-acetylase OafA/YrhL, contains acyltransferase and SGNH-hydrolase domains [Paraburkholderia fungorum]|uniref:Peptidoglycan/LPS O-acetylase OafA/YrhL, contains acyltransferase and SGNH-hydrolase domains n=1 Tax=Paraburkholderia fungorum TaxID=134537 RepID=A0A1H1BVY8_9BURK|nr:acyltransferase [Paraburkholderia fungorum]SDQ56061.1 Peptidoglycan/LPS O-acetylase OafA/YrhL, contains acyltransferase and SGNH-hydrolase domains [Paraburkholderia fungorum]
MTASALPLAPTHSRIVQLDGLRAIAVLAVFAQHALKAPLWMGVDLFFVLSGFLISGILLERKAREQSYFGYFYARRARRILPPYVLLMVVSSILFGLGWAQHWYWYTFFATNIGDALNQSGHDSLNVLWSLAVEEQFYIFWPFVILLVPERVLGYVAAALIVLVPVLRAVATPWFDSFWPIYYLTPFRMDLLAAGALLAVAVRRDRNALEPFKGLAVLGFFAALAVLAWLHLHYPRFRAANTPLSNAGLYSVSLVLCTSVVVIALQSKGIVKRLLCNPVLVYIGTISYTIYLIHLSVLYMLWPLHMNRYATAALALAITLLYATITWFAFEKRLIFGSAQKKAQARMHGAASESVATASVARQTPQSRA